MSRQLGHYNTSGTRTHVRFQFTTHASAGGNVAPSSAFEAADIRIYRANDGAAYSATQRSSANGITMTSPFDSLTGVHDVDIDLTDNTDAGFYAAGYRYSVVLAPDETVDSQTITGVVLAEFEIGPPPANVTQFGGTAGTFSGGRPEVNATHWGGTAVGSTEVRANLINIAGSAVSTSSAQLGVNVVNAAGTAWGSGAITAASIAADAITAAKIADGAIDAATFAAGAITASAIAADAITDAKVASDVTIASVTGAVGSVTGNVGGNVAGSVASVTARVTANVDQLNGTSIAGTGTRVADSFVTLLNVASPVLTVASVNQTGDNYARLGAPAGASVSADVAEVKTDTGNLVTRITSTLFSGITSLAQWLGLLAGKQTGNSTARTELRATGAGSGTFDETTDSLEAARDNVGTAGAGLTAADDAVITAIAALNNLSAAQVWASGTRTLTATGLDLVLVDGKTLPAAVQIVAATTAGKVSGAGSGTEVFIGLDGSTTRATVTVDDDGNRTGVTYG